MSGSLNARSALSVLFMVLFIAALAVYGLASGKAVSSVGISNIAAVGNRLFVLLDGNLLEASDEGELLHRWPAALVGLDAVPVDLRALDDGRVLIAGVRPTKMVICASAPLHCTQVGRSLAGNIRDRYRVFPDASAHRLLIADFGGSRLWQMPLDGDDGLTPVATEPLSRVEDLLLDTQGTLWVADAGHRRILALHRSAAGAWTVERDLADAGTIAGPGLDWPVRLAAGSDGTLWAIQSKSDLRDGALAIYDPRQGTVARVALPSGVEPADIARVGDAMVVVDATGFRLVRVDVATHRVADFGPNTLSLALGDAHERRAGYARRVHQAVAAMVIFGILMIGTAVWATPKDKRWTKPPVVTPIEASTAPMPRLSGVYWLKRNPKTDRFLTWAYRGFYLVAALVMFSAYALYRLIHSDLPATLAPDELARVHEGGQVLTLMVLTFAGLPLLIRLGMRTLQASLGTDGQRLYVRMPDGRLHSFAPEQLVYGDRVILHEHQAFATRTGKGQPLYADGEIETYIAPLLPRAKKLNMLGLLGYQLRHREATLMSTLIFAAIISAFALKTGVWRHF